MFCSCEKPLPDVDDLSCVLCGHASVSAIRVDTLDVELQKRRRNGYRLERDCAIECYRHGGVVPCECEEGDAGTWHDGC